MGGGGRCGGAPGGLGHLQLASNLQECVEWWLECGVVGQLGPPAAGEQLTRRCEWRLECGEQCGGVSERQVLIHFLRLPTLPNHTTDPDPLPPLPACLPAFPAVASQVRIQHLSSMLREAIMLLVHTSPISPLTSAFFTPTARLPNHHTTDPSSAPEQQVQGGDSDAGCGHVCACPPIGRCGAQPSHGGFTAQEGGCGHQRL